jgi:hypothetical protein
LGCETLPKCNLNFFNGIFYHNNPYFYFYFFPNLEKLTLYDGCGKKVIEAKIGDVDEKEEWGIN